MPLTPALGRRIQGAFAHKKDPSGMPYNPHSPENARVEDAVEEATLAVLAEIDQAIRDNWREFVANVLEDARSNAGVYDDPDALFDPDGICTGQDVFQRLGYFKREPAPTGG